MDLHETDAEFMERYEHFSDIEVINEEGQATTTMEDRLEKGIQAQADIFGEGMREAWKAGHMNWWLAANCFGDYYTRTGLTLSQREMITFCFLSAQGGFPVPPLYWVSEEPQCDYLYQ